ncbi:AGC protein kinase [Capsaspora owczarzaki ATCC 30864]|uniref:AGC protein kinase n=1 Tax=Capsaspora owczarzaki (strain ATCC 30864) TaxID=595528 RepID=A0A0D2U0G2_CAPO3|nr:AGC protein kinase [Capsaspora owczarzaki ATCC 30864]
MASYPTNDLSKFDVVPVTINTTVQEVASKLGGQLFVRTPNGVERRMRQDESPLRLLCDNLFLLGYQAAEIPEESAKDHSYVLRFVAGLSRLATPEETISIKGLLMEGKKWDNRFCIIKGNKLIEYESPSATKPLLTLSLTGALVSEVEEKKKPFVFGVRELGAKNPVLFACESAVDRKNWLSRIAPIASKDPNAVNLAQRSLEALPADVLTSKAATTTALELAKNLISPLQDYSAFKTMTRIQLIDNNLQEFPTGLFSVPSLSEIDLSRNQIRAIPPGISKLSNLRILAVHNNQLSTLPNELSTLNKLTTLVLAFNDFATLPPVICQLVELHQLILTSNALEVLPDGIGNLTKLTLLDVRFNKLSSLPASMSRLVSLTRIDIRQNPLQQFPPVLANLPKLETLDIGPNNFARAPALDVALPALKTIRAPEAFLGSLNFTVLPQMLTKINLTDNGLTSLPEAIGDLPNLESLIVKNNQLRSLPAKIFAIPTLKWLYAAYNQIEVLPEKFAKCLIQIFEVQHNRLQKLPDKLLKFCYMTRVLNVSNNMLTELPALSDTDELNAVEELYVGQNRLNDAQVDKITGMLKLRILDVSYNGLTAVSGNISRLTELGTLNVAGNKLTELPRSINRLKKLKYVLANSNKLRDLPPLPESLVHLDLGCNRLAAIPASVRALPVLELLDVSGNTKLVVEGQFATTALQRITAEAVANVRGLSDAHAKKTEAGGYLLGDVWSYGSADIMGRRLRMEDSLVKMRRVRGNEFEAIFGVFDGHSGPDVADILAKSFPVAIENELGRLGNADPLAALRSAFLCANRDIGEAGYRCGSTGAVVYLQRLDSGVVRLFAANIGDTEALICRGGNTYELLTTKHSIENQVERNRILSQGGFFSDDDRVNGILAATRAFGDSYLNPYVSPEPFLKAINIQPADEFVILACDGLWDVVSYELAVEIARSVPDPVSAAKKLRDLAYLYGSEDNISVVVIKFGIHVHEDSAEEAAEAAEMQQRAANDAKLAAESRSAADTFFADLSFVKWIGEGSFGKVALAQRKSNKEYVAVKTVPKNDTNAPEIAIERSFERLRHPNICRIVASTETTSHAFFILEYLGGGSFKVPTRPEDKFPEKLGRFYACQIAAALRYLHKQGIIYRDLALHNLMFDTAGNVKVIDFGLCVPAGGRGAAFAGTPGFMAPEMVANRPFDKTVDWWGLGVVMYMMLVGRPPFFADDIGIVNEEPYLPHSLGKTAKAAIKALLEKDATKRLGASVDEADIIKHPFFKEIDFAKLEAGQIKPPVAPTPISVQPAPAGTFTGWA